MALLVNSGARAQEATPSAPVAPSADQMAKPAAAKAKKAANAATDAATPAPDAAKAADDGKPAAKPKSDKGSVTVSVLNKRDVALKSMTAIATGGDGDPKKVIGAVKPGKRGVGHVARTKDCLYDLHGDYEDGSVFEASSVDLCKSSGFNLKD
jgi:hypothetical protein